MYLASRLPQYVARKKQQQASAAIRPFPGAATFAGDVCLDW
jgi:hypothetical protein